MKEAVEKEEYDVAAMTRDEVRGLEMEDSVA
eukprot:CAMPEP_0118950320 /NCGR_PEP_ID=MMETSP1169-20130426/51176_1 /TAXON_ID=36882 /ORGANISM="Pyramimonas obovata, Strain CCMP722" /LENGTH=30 /DNA_ID= /DNA_START= /DNA_END= /DNA_ORIENTATION=